MSVAALVERWVSETPVGDFLRSSDVPGSRNAVDTAFSRIAAGRPDLVRVSRGLYWRGSQTRFGVTRPEPLDAAVATAGDGAGPAGWSALAALGLTTQVPARPHVAVPGRQPAVRDAKVTRRSNVRRFELTPVEVAVLEALRPEWSARADGDVITRIHQLADERQIRPGQVRAAARGEQGPVREAVERALGSLG